MSSSHPVTTWIDQLRAGDQIAAEQLWRVYFQRMVELAQRKLSGAPRAGADEEDVALSAFKSFCLGVQNGRFPQLLGADNLWPLLMAITLNKSVDLIRGENRLKRGGTGQPTSGSESPEPRAMRESLSEILSLEPSPEFTAELADQIHRLMARLDATGDPDLRRIAMWKMQGDSTSDVAARLDCVNRTVERKIQLISRLWENET